ncbi:MAG: EI24 domain-containing protein [Kiritimatiellae bacterium]|nr:EI24 domain-containing protein [Kiritimatiellia bacterium]
MDKTEVKFGEWMEKGFNLYTKGNMGLLVLVALVGMLLSAVTVGILSGPMMAGTVLITLRLARGQQAELNDLFKGFQYFLQSFLLYFVWGLIAFVLTLVLGMIPCLGSILSILIVYAIQTAVMFALFLIVDQGMDFWPATMKAFETIKSNIWPFLGFGFVAMLIGSLGAILCGIGIILTLPAAICMFTVAYLDVFEQGAITVKAVEEQPAPPAEEKPAEETPVNPDGNNA